MLLFLCYKDASVLSPLLANTPGISYSNKIQKYEFITFLLVCLFCLWIFKFPPLETRLYFLRRSLIEYRSDDKQCDKASYLAVCRLHSRLPLCINIGQLAFLIVPILRTRQRPRRRRPYRSKRSIINTSYVTIIY